MTSGKPIIGLTGGIASGKSTVARILRELGVSVVDADQLAREVVAAGTDGLREVVAAFGSEILDGRGELDRPKLGELVFRDPAARERLNAITHPRIARLSAERIAGAQASATPYVIYEAALLVETGAHRGLDALIVVAASDHVQLARTMARDGLPEAAVRARLDAQLPLATKVREATFVIQNDADLRALREATHRTHRAVLERFQLSGAEA